MSTNFALPAGVKQEEERDSVGSSGPLESGVYDGTIEMVYLGASEKGAKNFTIVFKTASGRTVRQTIYYTNRAGELTYMCKRDKVPKPLPGYTQLSQIIESITGKPITDGQDIETKSIKEMDWSVRKEVPVEREVFMDTVGIKMKVAVLKVAEEKTTAESNYKDGTGEFRDINEFDKFFDEDGVSNIERKAGKTEAAFMATWLTKNDAKTKVRKAKNPGTKAAAPVAGAPIAPELGGVAPTSMFT